MSEQILTDQVQTSADEVQTGTIETMIPARLDRLPWSRFHWRVIIGLGTAWILDGLEVNVVGSISSRLSEHAAGVGLSAGDLSGWAASLYIAGACVGAIVFGQLTDRFGRKRLFMVTLGIYLAGTVLTAFAFSPAWFFVFRFVTGAGIGGEYSAINSAIDELIPARQRGRVDLTINGSYWLGGVGGSLLAVVMLNTAIFPANLGWRLSFVLGAVIGLAVLFVRRSVPESPRWLFIHGREQEAERIVAGIEREVAAQHGPLPEVEGDPLKVHQRRTIPLTTIVRSVVTMYPRRTILGLALFIGQAFLYNAVLFSFGELLNMYFHTPSGNVPYYLAVFAAGNFAGAVLLSPLFDTVGRKPMIAGTYILSGALLIVTAVLFRDHRLDAVTFTACCCVVFFFASAGASAAYLTVSEVFPLETRALCIAVFYAVGTGIGGALLGPQIFSRLIGTGSYQQVFLALGLGALVMIVGGVTELVLGVKAERMSLERIATPLTAAGEAAPAMSRPSAVAA